MAEFIFMLTRNDQTVGNCLEVIELISQVGVRHIGFKDVGVDPQTMGTLTQEIHRIGALACGKPVLTFNSSIVISTEVPCRTPLLQMAYMKPT